MAQQTAVEWFEEHLKLNGLADFVTVEEEDLYKKLKQQAKEMEKQQMIDMYTEGEGILSESDSKAKQYYTQTYGK